jgi:hypothetical protein
MVLNVRVVPHGGNRAKVASSALNFYLDLEAANKRKPCVRHDGIFSGRPRPPERV